MPIIPNVQATHTSPHINVTPLIDVLLVLLIIFMVITPLKPSRFKALMPQPPLDIPVNPNPLTLVVMIDKNLRLQLNKTGDVGGINDMGKLSAELTRIFKERTDNHTYKYEAVNQPALTEHSRVERTVFIKAPRSIGYGEVTKVIDIIKGAGADPVGLQIDDLVE